MGGLLAPDSGLQFAAEIVLALLLVGLLVWIAGGGTTETLTRRPRRWLERPLERERDLARGLGLRSQVWLGFRGAAVLAALVAFAVTRIFIVFAGGLLGAVFVLPWMLSHRARKQQLAVEKAFVRAMREVPELMQSASFDESLKDVARARKEGLGDVLDPLTGDAAVDPALREVARRSRSRLIRAICVRFIAARNRSDSAELREILETLILPRAETMIESQETNLQTIGQQRGVVYIISGAIGILLWVMLSLVPTFHQFYASLSGQVVLVAIGGWVVICVFWMVKSVKPIEYVDWDLDLFIEKFGRG